MATVYLAHDVDLERPVAVKVLAENRAGDREFRERFLREARLAARLVHPHVVQVFDAGEDEGRPYIVMEYVDGETLAERLGRTGKLGPAEAVDLALQVCRGLHHAHEHGLVHRDIKPANLLVRRDGIVKIADFGIARAAETTGLTQTGTVLGTAAYLSPEQAAGERVTPKTDLYSLGAVLYEALAGRTPYQLRSLTELPAKQQAGATPLRELRPDVSAALEDAIMHCLARNPRYRPQSAASLARELTAALPEPPTEPLPTEPRPVAAAASAGALERGAIRDRTRWLIAATIVVLIALGLGIWGFARNGSGNTNPPPVRRVPPPAAGADYRREAANLRDWLRKHAR
jgi:serine/threonine-protein kinase